MKQGSSLLELLLALLLLGLLSGLFLLGYQNLRDRAQVEEAARKLAHALEQARTEARVKGQTRCVKIFPSDTDPGGYALGADCSGLSDPTRRLPGVALSVGNAASLSVAYAPPYGEAIQGMGAEAVVSRKGWSKTVRVVGPLGKVVVR